MKTNRMFIVTAAFALTTLLLSGCGGDSPVSEPKPDPKPDPKPSASDLVSFPKGSEPAVVGVKLVERFINVRHSFWGNINSTLWADHITYPDVCAWLGAFWFAEETKNDALWNRLADKFDLLFTSESNLQPNLNTTASNKVDYYVFGAVPLYIYQRRKDVKYLNLGLKYADGQYTLPSNASTTARNWHNQGYSWQTRLWIDDMFMITALQAQAYLATGDEKYIERAAKGMVLYLDRLQQDNGLFHHASNAKFFWARGNGWMAVGMPEVLRMMPKTAAYDTYRERIMEGYKKMMEGLYRFQMYDGMWLQLVDLITNSSVWRETSGSAMFTYAFLLGVKNGWLDKEKYGTAARKAWIALQAYLTENYDIREVCEGTGEGYTLEYYLNRRRWVGDMHGQAGMLWSAFALAGIANDSKN